MSVPAPAAVSYDTGSRHVEEIVRSPTLALRGPIRALIISSLADRGSLLLHRLAELHARLRVGQFPQGADLHDRLFVRSRDWTNGFWPGALWRAAALVHGAGGRMFADWALSATLAHLGQERTRTHDVGFMYVESSLAGWRALCSSAGHAPVCRRLKASVVAAARELTRLAASNSRAGTIPTNSTQPYADTIIDSMMNIQILPWATRFTGDRAFIRLASRHAHTVARLLVRADGSTAQSVHFDRASGRVLLVHTHQGLSSSSTWSRGEGWALYGFAHGAADLHDPRLLRVALRVAGYVERHLPASGVPAWDYDARSGAPVDVSAGTITAAGMFHLIAACRRLSGVCGDTSRFASLGRRMLAAALGYASARVPLGLLRGQELNEHAGARWYNGGELIFGLSYALDGLRAGLT